MEQSKFILEVQSRPCIWNHRVDSYLDRPLKRRAWEEVAEKMCDDFLSFSDDDKRKTVLELQRKWKALTDYYKRRNIKEDIDERTNHIKPIVELLKFLDDVQVHNDSAYASKCRNCFECSMENDPNQNFLQSLLPDMRSLNDHQRFEFKLGVMKLIKSIKYDREVPTAQNIASETGVSLERSIPTFEDSPRSMSPLNFSIGRYYQLSPKFYK